MIANSVAKMKNVLMLTFALCLIHTESAGAQTKPLETGLFQDKSGFVDKHTGHSVKDAQNLMGYRYIAIQTKLQGSTVKDVAVFNEKGIPIKTGTPLNISVLKINGVDQKNALLKLWLKMDAGTKFKIIYYFK